MNDQKLKGLKSFEEKESCSSRVQCQYHRATLQLEQHGDCSVPRRFLLHVAWAVGALFQDMADEAVQRAGQESAALCRQIQHSLAEALSKMSMYDMARPATQTLLADHKCLITTLKQDAHPTVSGEGLAAGVLMLPDLLWDDGLAPLSQALAHLDSDAQGPSADQAGQGISISLMAQDSVDAVGPTSMPDSEARDMLIELGMPSRDATRCSSRLAHDAAKLAKVRAALRPSFRWQLEAYLRSELGSGELVCALPPQELPPVVPCWGTINASSDGARSLIETSNALGRFAWRGVSIASFDSKHGGQEVGGWSFLDEGFFGGTNGKQVTASGEGQVRLVLLSCLKNCVSQAAGTKEAF